MRWIDLFYLDEDGRDVEGRERWIIRHQFTGHPAGRLCRSADGLTLWSDPEDLLGRYADLDSALRKLYSLA